MRHTNTLPTILVLIVILAAIGYVNVSPGARPPATAEPAEGAITGTIIYPGEFIPNQRVCAESVDAAGPAYCTDVAGQSPQFSITVPPGRYHVYAILLAEPLGWGGYRAYYNDFVACGMTTQCHDRTNIAVSVEAGRETANVKPHDWYGE